jgi:hypothetical protein
MAQRKVASGFKSMSQPAPPRWLETLLLRCLPARDQETISGDLLEEYREAQIPQLGPMRANLWYARQLIGFLATRSVGGSTIRASLTWTSMFTALSGLWLAVMENILEHPGYGARSAIAAGIAIQGVSTILFLMWHGRPIFRVIVQLGAVGAVLVGASALIRITHAVHFEGFVFLIASALFVQGAMASVVLARARREKAV